MTIRQFIKNIKLSNLYHIVQSKLRQMSKPLPDEEILAKVADCPQCFNAGECLRCGCDFHDVVASDKQCKKLMPGDTVAIKSAHGSWTIATRTEGGFIPNTIPTPYLDIIVLNYAKDEI